MNCPRCDNYIVPEFYCINCGYVPARIQDPDPQHRAELGLRMSLIGGYDNQRDLSPALSLSDAMAIGPNGNSAHGGERKN